MQEDKSPSDTLVNEEQELNIELQLVQEDKSPSDTLVNEEQELNIELQ